MSRDDAVTYRRFLAVVKAHARALRGFLRARHDTGPRELLDATTSKR